LTGTGKHTAQSDRHNFARLIDRFASNQQINEKSENLIMTLNARDAEGFTDCQKVNRL
jgi:hypothetical protein